LHHGLLGIAEYSVFRRGQQLFLYMRVPDFDLVTRQLAVSDVNRRWQQRMAPMFETVLDIQPGEAQAMMHEVFFMPGITSDEEQLLLEESQTK
jgi:L-rhamnose mutarotase